MIPFTPSYEDELVRSAQGGDREAAALLADRYWEGVFGFTFRLTLNVTDAEDIAQETFFRAFRGLGRYRPDGQFKAWLLRIATNLYLDQKKSAHSQQVVATDLGGFSGSAWQQPDAVAGRRELVRAVEQAIKQLSREQQITIVLRAVENMEYAQIAQILEIRESTVRWHMFEARRLLVQKLGKEFELEGAVQEGAGRE